MKLDLRPTELEILRLLESGMAVKRIASVINYSTATPLYRARIRNGMKTTIQLCVAAVRQGLI